MQQLHRVRPSLFQPMPWIVEGVRETPADVPTDSEIGAEVHVLSDDEAASTMSDTASVVGQSLLGSGEDSVESERGISEFDEAPVELDLSAQCGHWHGKTNSMDFQVKVRVMRRIPLLEGSAKKPSVQGTTMMMLEIAGFGNCSCCGGQVPEVVGGTIPDVQGSLRPEFAFIQTRSGNCPIWDNR